MSDTLAKIAALLRQAESTNHEAEREAFMAKAQQLATIAAIDLAEAQAYVPAHERREQPISKVINIAGPGVPTKGLGTYVQLFMRIGWANDLRFDVAANSRYVIAFGFPSDIETTELLYGSLVVQMVEASNAYIKSGEYKHEKVARRIRKTDPWSGRSYTDWGYAPVHGMTARINFQDAFARTVGDRLKATRQDVINARDSVKPVGAQALTDGTPSETPVSSTALVLKAKTDEVKSFHKTTSKAKGTWSGSRAGAYSDSARDAGAEAGQRAQIGKRRALQS